MLRRDMLPDGRTGDPRPMGGAWLDRRMSTILFADVVGSTRIVAAADPEEARERLLNKLKSMASHICRFGGTVCQTMGDGIFAVFGAPHSLEDHAVRACLAAEAISRDGRLDGLKVRVGLGSGEILWDGDAVTAGQRSPAIGLSVHIAAKLQNQAPAGEVHLCETTQKIAAPWVDSEEVGLFAADDGISVGVYGLRHVRRRRRRMPTSPLIGRERELGLLQAALDGVASGRGSSHLLVGPAGIGKSRLAAELVDLAPCRNVRVLDWQINPIRPVGAPEPLQELVAELLDRELPEHRAELEAALADQGVRPQAAAALADFVLPDQRRPIHAAADAMLEAAADGAATLVAAVARRQPLLVLVDDLHCAGSEVAAAFGAIVERAGTYMVLATSRETPAEMSAALTVTPVEAFDARTARIMLDRMLGDAPGLDRVKRSLITRSGGNPFFLTELVQGMVMDRILVGAPGQYVLGAEGRGRLPSSIRTLLTARIDALTVHEKRTLLAAAVVGPTFDAKLLGQLLQLGLDETIDTLWRLVETGLLDSTRLLPRQEFSFCHALVHETACATLTRRHRRDFHRSLVSILETADFADLPGRLPALARHAFDGELWVKAVEIGREAGTDAFSRCLAAEGIELLTRALEANGNLPHCPESAAMERELRLLLARTYMMTGEPDRTARTLIEASRPACSTRVERDAQALSLLMSAHIAMGRIAEAIRYGQQALEASAQLDANGEPHHEVLRVYGIALADRGDFIRAFEVLTKARELSELGRQEKGAYFRLDARIAISVHLARCLAEFGDTSGGERELEFANILLRNERFSFNHLYYSVFKSEIDLGNGNFQSAKSAAQLALDTISNTGAKMFQHYALALLGAASARLGMTETGLQQQKAAIFESQQGSKTRYGEMLFLFADSLHALGRIGEAMEVGQKCLAESVISGAEGTGAKALELLARCHLATGDVRAALRMANSAKAKADRLGMARLAQQCGTLLGHVGKLAVPV